MISYAQNFEDVMLWRAFKHVKKGFYVDVGAAWPDFDSVTKWFYDNGWTGINIEPNPVLFDRYELERSSDTNLQLTISDSEGKTDIFITNYLDGKATGLTSLSE